jgi:hypothetical protein
MRITHNLHFGQVKVEDFTENTGGGHSFVTVELCHDDNISGAALYLYKPAECDELIKALAAAKSMLLGETSDPAPALAAQCEEPHPGQGGLICTRPAGHGGGHKDERKDVYWPRHDGGSEDAKPAERDAAATDHDTFTCCETALPWPTKTEDRTCPECKTVWEREPADLGAGARIKHSPYAEPGPDLDAALTPPGYSLPAGELPSKADV